MKPAVGAIATATAPAQANGIDIAQMVEATREGSASSAPGSNMVRCTPTTKAAVTSATFIIREASAQPAIGRGLGVEPSLTVVGAPAAGAAFSGFRVSRSGSESALARVGGSAGSWTLRGGGEGTSVAGVSQRSRGRAPSDAVLRASFQRRISAFGSRMLSRSRATSSSRALSSPR
eukprot:6206461-Pleurochrysis_carterae.AAC.1